MILSETQSICPVCHKPIDAFYVEEERDNRVFFVQHCPEHGEFRTLASEYADDFKRWTKNPVINIPPKQAITKGDPDDRSCPLYCGNCENHLQTTCCVLIDLTDRCNQSCKYCFAKSEKDMDTSGEPSLKEIEAKFDRLLELGEDGREFNIQLSGGEPTVRDDLPEIIRLAKDKGFRYVQINSNGRRLAQEEGYAQKLAEAGASVIFMQFDGTNDDIYMALRGEPLFETKVTAIKNCEKAGLAVTLVPTVVRGVNNQNIGDIMDFLVENVNVVKGVHFQPASFFGRYPDGDEADGRITMFGLLRELELQRPEFRVEGSLPISTGHTLCCFYSTYIKEPDGSIRCTLTQRAKGESASCCCDTQNSDSCCCDTQNSDSCCCDTQNSDSCCCKPETAKSVDSVSCCDMTQADQLEVIRKDRDYVLNKWDVSVPEYSNCAPDKWELSGPENVDKRAEKACSCSCCQSREEPALKSSMEITDMDEFLKYYRRNTFTVTGMAFQDVTNLDAERLKRCRVVQLTDDNRLVPFCAYNSIYR